MHRRRTTCLLVAVALLVAACSEPETTRITARVAAGEEPADGLSAGNPLAAGALRLYSGDDLILETDLESDGTAEIDVAPGRYTLQVMAPGRAPGCFWGTTVADVDLPGPPLTVDVYDICSG